MMSDESLLKKEMNLQQRDIEDEAYGKIRERKCRAH
jgi:hypothetical protein